MWPGIRGNLHEDPDRIRRPIIKVDGQWREVSWDAAFRRCTELLGDREVRDRLGHLPLPAPRAHPGAMRGFASRRVVDSHVAASVE